MNFFLTAGPSPFGQESPLGQEFSPDIDFLFTKPSTVGTCSVKSTLNANYFCGCLGRNQKPACLHTSNVKSQKVSPCYPGFIGAISANDWCIIVIPD